MDGSLTTSDGASLGYLRAGSGPPLVLVHGGATTARCFEPVLAALASRWDVVAYDRRGRRWSTDGAEPASLAREGEDLAEVIDGLAGGGPVDVLGYSYGGLVTLHALPRLGGRVRRAVVYEAPFGVPGMLPDGLLDEVARLVAAGERNAACRLFVRDTFRLPDRVVDAFERGPLWQDALDATPTMERELRALEAARPDPALAGVAVPVRYLVEPVAGNPAFRDIAAELVALMPNADVAPVGGIPHFAIPSDTERFLAAVTEHLAGGA